MRRAVAGVNHLPTGDAHRLDAAVRRGAYQQRAGGVHLRQPPLQVAQLVAVGRDLIIKVRRAGDDIALESGYLQPLLDQLGVEILIDALLLVVEIALIGELIVVDKPALL